LFYDIRSSLCARLDHCQNVGVFRRVGIAPQHLSTHQDRRKYIVEVMSDATCQLADTFKTLIAQEECLQLFLFGDIGVNDQNCSWPA